MEEMDLWQRFCKSGKVKDYLEYIKSASTEGGYTNGTSKDKGIDSQSSQSQ